MKAAVTAEERAALARRYPITEPVPIEVTRRYRPADVAVAKRRKSKTQVGKMASRRLQERRAAGPNTGKGWLVSDGGWT